LEVGQFQVSTRLPEARRLTSWYSWQRFPCVFPNDSKRNVIVEITSNAGQNVPHGNICSLQLRFVSDTRLHEHLCPLYRPTPKNYFSCSDGTKTRTLMLELNPCRAVAVE